MARGYQGGAHAGGNLVRPHICHCFCHNLSLSGLYKGNLRSVRTRLVQRADMVLRRARAPPAPPALGGVGGATSADDRSPLTGLSHVYTRLAAITICSYCFIFSNNQYLVPE